MSLKLSARSNPAEKAIAVAEGLARDASRSLRLAVRIAHLDLYRLAGLGEDDEDLIDEELEGDVVAFVEWPGPAEALVADRVVLEVELGHAGGDSRDVVLAWRAPR